MNKWFLAVKKRGENPFDVRGMTLIMPPEGHYYADPFIIKKDGKTHVFYEDYDYEKGRIAHAILQDDLTLKQPEIVLQRLEHISFPCIFEENGEVYMVIESVLSGELCIYRASMFPRVWEEITTVATGRFDDPILFKIGNKYRIYATEGENNLRIFESDSIMGAWDMKIRDSIQHSRNAGTIFSHNGRLIRPCQDSTPVYGKAIVFKDLETGNEISRIEPDWMPGLTGCHTFNVTDDYVIIDGRIKIS